MRGVRVPQDHRQAIMRGIAPNYNSCTSYQQDPADLHCTIKAEPELRHPLRNNQWLSATTYLTPVAVIC